MPKLRRNPDIKRLEGWLFAHRGLYDNKSIAPENSLKAFELAAANGYGIELDVQLTKDNILVIHHDKSTLRSCGIDKNVTETEFEELSRYRLFSSEEKLPTLREVTALIDGRVPIIIELKAIRGAESLCKAVADELKSYHGTYCIQSFNPIVLLWYKKHYPKVIRGQLSTDFIKEKHPGNKLQYFLLKHLLFNFITRPDFISYHHPYKKSLSITICRKLYRTKTFAWTVQSKEDLDICRDYYDFFIFDSFLPNSREDNEQVL